VLEKAARELHNIGASFGGNAQPTKFLCLVLKLLQIHPSQDLIDEFIHQEEFKYVRVLGAMYKRLTGRPPDIYEQLEPLLSDYRKLRYRDVFEWRLIHMDEFVHQLLTSDRVCGIALPRLPARQMLEDEGYLEGPYVSPLQAVVDEQHQSSLTTYLEYKVKQGSDAAKQLWDERERIRKQREDEQRKLEEARKLIRQRNKRGGGGAAGDTRRSDDDGYGGGRCGGSDNGARSDDRRNDHRKDEWELGCRDNFRKRHREEGRGYASEGMKKKTKKEDDRKYGTLFKSGKTTSHQVAASTSEGPMDAVADEESEEYWNQQRAKLGLKPLKK
jgi:pre-mRNA-splicing factor 38A